MEGKIAESIIIKVGHGIMEIPRNVPPVQDPEIIHAHTVKSRESQKKSAKLTKQDSSGL